MLLVAIEIVLGALLRGGSIALKSTGEGDAGVIVLATGDRAALPHEVLAFLRDADHGSPSPRSVHCIYAHVLSRESGLSMTVDVAEGALSLTLT